LKLVLHCIVGFDWKMHFVWEPLLEKEIQEQKTDPTHAIRYNF